MDGNFASLQETSATLALVVTFDRLPLAGFGCYGNEWVDTTTFDTLAADGFVFDTNIASRVPHSDNLAAGISADWLADLIAGDGQAILIREPESRGLPGLPDNCQVFECEPGVAPPASATEMPFGRLILTAQSWFAEHPDRNRPTVLWLHSAGLPDDCLPPPDAWDLYAEEFAEEGIDWATLTDEEILQHPAIRAAYLSLMDHWLGELLATVRERSDKVLIQVCGLAGWPWLTASRRETIPGGLEAVQIQSPWILGEWSRIETPRSWEPGRSAAVVQPGDLGPTVLEWLGIPCQNRDGGRSLWPLVRGTSAEIRPWGMTQGIGQACSVWTPEDQVVLAAPDLPPGTSEEATARRYLQPEDPWNVLDVASQSGERVEEVALWLRESRPTDASRLRPS